MFCNNLINSLYIQNNKSVLGMGVVFNRLGYLSVINSKFTPGMINRNYSTKNLNSKDFDFMFEKNISKNKNLIGSIVNNSNIKNIEYNDISILRDYQNEKIYEKIYEILNNANLDQNKIIEVNDSLSRLITLIEIIKGDVKIADVNQIKKKIIYVEVEKFGIDTSKIKKLFKEYENSGSALEIDENLTINEGHLN